MLEIVTAFAVGLLLLCILAKLISIPLKWMKKLITSSIAGVILLWLLNLLGAHVAINFLNVLLAGFLGIPGIVVVLLLTYV